MGTCASLAAKCRANTRQQVQLTIADTQTEEMYFTIFDKLASTGAATICIEPVRDRSKSFASTVCHNDSNVGMESDTPLAAYEDVLILVENLQNLCKDLTTKEQISVLCAVNYLRLYCGLLDSKEKKKVGRKGKRRTSMGSMGSSLGVDVGMISNENSDITYWLSTFGLDEGAETKEEVVSKRRFKKAAMAVRTAIMMAGSFKNASFVAEHVKDDSAYGFYLRKNLYSWDFDPFEMDMLSSQRSISAIFREIVLVSNLVNEFKLDLQKLDAFCATIESGYNLHGNPYHNAIHGADVLQTIFCLLSNTGIAKWFSTLELLAMVFAAMIHDVEHTGTSNIFHQKSQSDLSLLYNDKSVLENHHVSVAFKALRDPTQNPFGRLTADQFKRFREIVIECVLATDMATHFNQVTELKEAVDVPNTITHQDVMNSLLHCADISAPAKRWEIHSKWTELVMEEFFAQGDKEVEMGLTVSPLCDRSTTNLPESQIGFISYITAPCYKVLGDAIDALLHEQQRDDFFALNGYARTTSMLQRRLSAKEHHQTSVLSATATNIKLPTLTPIEDPRQGRSSENLTTFNYTPIERWWEENFALNKAKWETEKQLEKDKKKGSMMTINETSESQVTGKNVSIGKISTITINESSCSESPATGQKVAVTVSKSNHNADLSADLSMLTTNEGSETESLSKADVSAAFDDRSMMKINESEES